MAIQDSDLFLIDDAGTSKTIRADKLQSGITGAYANMKLLVSISSNADDSVYTHQESRYVNVSDFQTNLTEKCWMMVDRGGTSYRVHSSEVLSYFPTGPAGASGVIQDVHSLGTPTQFGETSTITRVTSTPWNADDNWNWPDGVNKAGIVDGDITTLGFIRYYGTRAQNVDTSPLPIVVNKSIRWFCGVDHHGNNPNVAPIFNNVTSPTRINVDKNNKQWVDIDLSPFTLPLTINSFRSNGAKTTSDDDPACYINAIEVDGKILQNLEPLATLEFANNDGFEYFRVGDSLNNGDVLITAINNSAPYSITVQGGTWLGADGSTAGGAGGATKVARTDPFLTVASLPTTNFVDNEALRMVDADGNTAYYAPVTSAITNIEDTAITPSISFNTGSPAEGTAYANIWNGKYADYPADFTTAASGGIIQIRDIGVGGVSKIDYYVWSGLTSRVKINQEPNWGPGVGDGNGWRVAYEGEPIQLESLDLQMADGVSYIKVGAIRINDSYILGTDGKTLTFADPCPDLKFFNPGEVVQGSPEWTMQEGPNGYFGMSPDYLVTGGGGKHYRSSDGVTWEQTGNSTVGGQGAAYCFGTTWMSGGSGGIELSTDNGLTWTKTTATPTGQWHRVAYGAGRFVAVASNSNQAISSEDPGANGWNTHNLSGSSTNWRALEYANGIFMTGNSGGEIRKSTDGTTWTNAANLPGTDVYVSGIAYGDGYWVVTCGATGRVAVYYSDDNGDSWTETRANAPNTRATSPPQAVYGNGYWIAIGGWGDSWQAKDIDVWQYTGVVYDDLTLRGLKYFKGKFVATSHVRSISSTTGLPADNPVTILSRDPSTRQMFLNGGSWAVSNSSQVWSNDIVNQNGIPPSDFVNGFDGNVNSFTNSATGGFLTWTNTHGVTGALRIYTKHPSSSDSTGAVPHAAATKFDVSVTGGTGVTAQQAVVGWNTIPYTGTVNQIKIYSTVGSLSALLNAIEFDGEILVNDANSEQVWSTYMYGENQNGVKNNLRKPATNAFDGNSSTSCQSDNTDTDNYIVFHYTSGITVNTSFAFTIDSNTPGNKRYSINGGTEIGPLVNGLNTTSFTGTLTDFKIRDTNNQGGVDLVNLIVDGKQLVDRGVFGENEVTGMSRSGTGKSDGVPSGKIIRLKDSNNNWIDNTNRLGESFYVKNASGRMRVSRLLETAIAQASAWQAGTGYSEGAFVQHDGHYWLALSSSYDNSPDDNDPLDWLKLSQD